MMENFDLEEFSLSKLPGTVCYIPEFVTSEEEEQLLKVIYEAPKPKWTELSNRRLQNWGGIPQEKGMIAESIPRWLQDACDKVDETGVFGSHHPNHVLVNEYLPGQGIMPHTDGPMYHPVVANVTLGSHGVLEIYNAIQKDDVDTKGDGETTTVQGTSLEERHIGSILLERRSLLLVQDEVYSDYLHGICERTTDTLTDKFVNLDACPGRNVADVCQRTTRVSLTIRNVPKVIKARNLFGKRR